MTEVNSLVIEDLKKLIKTKGSSQAAAEHLGFSPSYLSEIMKGRRALSDNFLERLGYVRLIVHVKTADVPAIVQAIESAQGDAAHMQTLKSKVMKKSNGAKS